MAFSAWFSAVHHFSETNLSLFEQQLNQGWPQYLIALGILLISLVVIFRGLKKGIENMSKLLVPFFGIVITYLVGVSFSLEGALEKFAIFLKPDFQTLTANNVFAALGQAFFSLGLGGTFLLIYGSYLPDKQSIPSAAIWVGLGDMGAAVMASLFIIPAILVFNLDMTSGPQLIFHTLPRLFVQMQAGVWVGSLFLFALLTVAFLSNIAALEVLSGGIIDIHKVKLSKGKLILIIGILEAILILPSCLNPSLIGILDMIFGSGMQVPGSALSLLALGWGLGKITSLKQIFKVESGKFSQIFLFWIRWVIPLTLFVILISYIYHSTS